MLTGTDDQVAFPVTKALPLIDERRTFVDRDLIRNGATALLAAPIALPARLLATQGKVQAAARRLVGVDALVDAFVADGGLGVGLEPAICSGLQVSASLASTTAQVSSAMRGPFSLALRRACANAWACLGR